MALFGFHIIPPAFAALLQVILIDIVLAGDNAVVIGIAAALVPKPQRRRVIFWGLAAAVILRMTLATLTATLLATIGLTFAGGILLLWVSWRLYREITRSHEEAVGVETIGDMHHGIVPPRLPNPTPDVRRAILQIAAADLSMSLDNVLAVAGAATSHVWVLVVGLLLSVALMGFAASMIANLLQRYPWISYAGLTIIVYVALHMIWVGGMQIMHAA
ncbi:MAG: YjbE family putative metal transport protein [Rhizomicrobium sp.]|jgi:YjbE family integral membrane protein